MIEVATITGLINKLLTRLNRLLCPHRTENMIRRGRGTNRYFLECMDCGYETPGVLLKKG